MFFSRKQHALPDPEEHLILDFKIYLDLDEQQAVVIDTWFYEFEPELKEWIGYFAAISYVTKQAFNLQNESFIPTVTSLEPFEMDFLLITSNQLADPQATYHCDVYQKEAGSLFIRTPNEGIGAQEGIGAGSSASLLLRHLMSQDYCNPSLLTQALDLLHELTLNEQHDITNITHQFETPHAILQSLEKQGSIFPLLTEEE